MMMPATLLIERRSPRGDRTNRLVQFNRRTIHIHIMRSARASSRKSRHRQTMWLQKLPHGPPGPLARTLLYALAAWAEALGIGRNAPRPGPAVYGSAARARALLEGNGLGTVGADGNPARGAKMCHDGGTAGQDICLRASTLHQHGQADCTTKT